MENFKKDATSTRICANYETNLVTKFGKAQYQIQ